MSLKHKVLSGLMAAALSASLLACSSRPRTCRVLCTCLLTPLSLSADGDAQLCLSAGNGAEHTLWHSGRIF